MQVWESAFVASAACFGSSRTLAILCCDGLFLWAGWAVKGVTGWGDWGHAGCVRQVTGLSGTNHAQKSRPGIGDVVTKKKMALTQFVCRSFLRVPRSAGQAGFLRLYKIRDKSGDGLFLRPVPLSSFLVLALSADRRKGCRRRGRAPASTRAQRRSTKSGVSRSCWMRKRM